MALVLEVVEERADQPDIEVRELQPRCGLAGPLGREGEQQPLLG